MSDETERGAPPYGPPYGPPPYQQQPYQQQPQQQPQPYQQPPYQQPPYPSRPYGPPPRTAGSGRAVAAALGAIFVIATAIVAYVAHQAPTRSYSGARVASNSSAPSNGNSQRVVPVGTGSASTTTPYVPPAPATTTAAPSPPPLDPEAINRTFEGYMNALLDHDLGALHSATCPRLRHTEVGFELHGKYVRSWRGKPYAISPYASYVTVSALVGLRSPSTGASAGSATYSWYVERESGGRYYVCGFLS